MQDSGREGVGVEPNIVEDIAAQVALDLLGHGRREVVLERRGQLGLAV